MKVQYDLDEVSGVFLSFLRLEVSTFVSAFYKMLHKNKIVFSSIVDCFVWISETKGVVWFSVRKSLKIVVPVTYKNTPSVKSCKVLY
jgi:hypothetical protein